MVEGFPAEQDYAAVVRFLSKPNARIVYYHAPFRVYCAQYGEHWEHEMRLDRAMLDKLAADGLVSKTMHHGVAHYVKHNAAFDRIGIASLLIGDAIERANGTLSVPLDLVAPLVSDIVEELRVATAAKTNKPGPAKTKRKGR